MPAIAGAKRGLRPRPQTAKNRPIILIDQPPRTAIIALPWRDSQTTQAQVSKLSEASSPVPEKGKPPPPMPSEADTCRKFIVPKLQNAGWDTDPHSIAEQRYFTHGRIVVRGSKAERKRGKRADRLKKQQAALFSRFAPEARGILNELLEKYAADGELQFTLPDV